MSTPGCIGIVPLGRIPQIAPKVIAAHISGYMDLQTAILDPLGNPFYALNKQRLQFDAAAILRHMEAKPFRGFQKIIAVLSVDIYLPIFTHVFGEARQGGRVALVSLFRLGNAADHPLPITLERAAKVALHELCHLYDLAHCENHTCLMHFSGNLEELDQTPLNWCRYCRRFLKDAVSKSNVLGLIQKD